MQLYKDYADATPNTWWPEWYAQRIVMYLGTKAAPGEARVFGQPPAARSRVVGVQPNTVTSVGFTALFPFRS